MHTVEFLAISCYITILIGIAFFSFRKNQTSNDFIIGGRKMNFWLTALAAHASDMSSWIFVGYPVLIYQKGFSNVFVAIGLIVFMYFNWQLVAPRLRTSTEKYNAMTFSSFFESRFSDTSGILRILSALMCFGFYSIYISASFYGLGLFLESLFQIPYSYGVTLGLFIVIPYLFVGGYITLAWTDFFQGLFLLTVIVIVPSVAVYKLGGLTPVLAKLNSIQYFEHILPTPGWMGVLSAAAIAISWGIGYFGQPHIMTKFMGIRSAADTQKSKWVGMTWQVITLGAATCIGMIAIDFFKNPAFDPQLIFINMVKDLFSPFLSAFILCAILGTTITLADSQLLVLASTITEDFYKRILRKDASSKELLLVSRLSILFVSLIAYTIAMNHISTIFSLVEYAWFGLGASFGPLIIYSLYSKTANKYGAYAGILTGGIISAITPIVNNYFGTSVPPMIAGFALSCLAITVVSKLTYVKESA